jgi:hypothetical protein
MDFWSIVGFIVVLFVFIRFVKRLGEGLPIIELMLLIAGLQWVIGPLIEYTYPTFHYKYYMYVSEVNYMSYVVPAYSVFAIAILWTMKSYTSITIPVEKLKDFKKYGLTIFIIGVFFDVISGSLPGTLAFFAFLIANFKFAGAIIMFFSEDKRLRKIFYFALFYLLFSAIQQAMFHDLVLWAVFFFMFWAIKYKPSVKQIYVIIFIGLFSLTTLQTIKSAYRSEVWNGYQGNKMELFVGLFVDAVFLNSANAEELSGEENNVRLNQGWIISAIMDEIPKKVDFLEGETIIEAVSASILPRFLNPNKKKAGGRENFEKFTGLSLGEGTSMGISIIGEAYGNFKVFGGILFMGIWGWFLARCWGFFLKKTQKNLLLLAFLPIIFLQVVKAETELVVVLNHLVKASIVVFLFFWAVKRFLNWNLKHE